MKPIVETSLQLKSTVECEAYIRRAEGARGARGYHGMVLTRTAGEAKDLLVRKDTPQDRRPDPLTRFHSREKLLGWLRQRVGVELLEFQNEIGFG